MEKFKNHLNNLNENYCFRLGVLELKCIGLRYSGGKMVYPEHKEQSLDS